MAASGGKFNLVDALLELDRDGSSAVLRLENDGVKKQLVVRDGRLAFAESNVPEEHLARVLLDLGRITRADLRSISTLMRSGKTSDEAVLATRKVDAAGLAEGVREQAITILASLFAWSQCESRILSAAAALERPANLQMPLPELIVAGARRAVETRRLPAARARLEGSVSRSRAARAARLEPLLDTLEAAVYARTANRIGVAELVAQARSGSARPEEIVARLMLLGLITIEAEEARSAETPAPESRAAERRLGEQVEEMLQRFEVASHYEILSVRSEATTDEIQNSYHDLAKAFHPDRFQPPKYPAEFCNRVQRLFTYVNGAYTTLSDPAARAAYDEAQLADGRVEAARRARVGADAENTRIAETLFRAGRASMAERDFEKAVAHLKECVWLRPDAPRYRLYLGVAQSEIPKLRKEAEEHLLKAIELDRMGIENYLALGKLYLKVKLPRRAELQFQEVLRWVPHHAEAQRLLEGMGKEGEKAKRRER